MKKKFKIGDIVKLTNINNDFVICDDLGLKSAKDWELSCGPLKSSEKKKFPTNVYRLKSNKRPYKEENVPYAEFELKLKK